MISMAYLFVAVLYMSVKWYTIEASSHKGKGWKYLIPGLHLSNTMVVWFDTCDNGANFMAYNVGQNVLNSFQQLQLAWIEFTKA